MQKHELGLKIGQLLTEMQDISLAGFTAESRAKFDRMDSDLRSLEADMTRVEAVEKRDQNFNSFTRVARPGVESNGAGVRGGFASPEERKKKTGEAMTAYLRHGVQGMTMEHRDLLSTGGVGATIPQDFLPELIESQKIYGQTPFLLKQRQTNNAEPLKIAITNDTANGVQIIGTEGTAVPEVDPAFQNVILGADTITSGLVKVSFQALEDSAFDLGKFLTESFAKRFGRGTESAVTIGKDSLGTTMPNQISGGLVGNTTIAETTTALANGIGWTDLTALFSALDPAYTQNPKWVMSSGIRGYLIGLRDGFGRPYFQVSPGDSKPFQSILGYEIVLNQAMTQTLAANSIPIIFGSLEDAAIFRFDGSPTVLRLSERFADTLEVGFFGYQRIGSASIVASGAPNPLVSLKLAAS
jgi:HK97 family phage major capsid protein